MTDNVFVPNSKFTVRHFNQMMDKLTDEIDELNLSSGVSGVRGKAYIAAFTNLFSGDLDLFLKKVTTMPAAALKSLLVKILEEGYKKYLTEPIDELMKDMNESRIEEAVMQSFDGKPIRFELVLPISKKKLFIAPLSEVGIKKAVSLRRFDMIMESVIDIDGATYTKDGIRETILDMSYVDLEFIYLFISNINANLQKINWQDLLKKV